MGLVNENAVNAQFFKRDHIIFPALVVQSGQLFPNVFPGFRQLLNREILPFLRFQFSDAQGDLVQLLFQRKPLTFYAHGYLLKLRVTDDDSVIVPGGDTATKPLSIFCFKVLFGSHKDIRGGIELQILRRPLLRQVVGHHEQALLTQTQPLALLCRRCHFPRFPGPHHMA